MQDRGYRVRLLQMAAGYAAGRIRKPPGFCSSLPLYKHADRDAIEDRLLGLRRQKNTKDDNSYSKADFVSRWHFAAAVRALYQGRLEVAAKEFHFAGAKSSEGTDLQVFSRSLEDYCLGKGK